MYPKERPNCLPIVSCDSVGFELATTMSVNLKTIQQVSNFYFGKVVKIEKITFEYYLEAINIKISLC